jgi:hypothetical protein
MQVIHRGRGCTRAGTQHTSVNRSPRGPHGLVWSPTSQTSLLPALARGEHSVSSALPTPMQTHSAGTVQLCAGPQRTKTFVAEATVPQPLTGRGDMSRRPPVAGVGPTVVAGAPAPIELYDHVVSAYAYAPAAHDTHSIGSFDSDDGGVGNTDAWQTQSHHTPAGHARGGVSGGGGDHRSGAGPAVLPRGWADSVANYTPGEYRVVGYPFLLL